MNVNWASYYLNKNTQKLHTIALQRGFKSKLLTKINKYN